jgi:hypothetical protein
MNVILDLSWEMAIINQASFYAILFFAQDVILKAYEAHQSPRADAKQTG